MTPVLRGIPVIQPKPLYGDWSNGSGTPQPILQLKELVVDQIRYQEWKAQLSHPPRKRSRRVTVNRL